MQKKIMLVDGMALLFRGFYATSYRGNFMKTKEGVPTNGIYQFLRYLFDAIDEFEPTHVICCWDMGSKTFRTDLYPNYKANRSAPPEELIPQFDLVKEVTEALNIPNIGLKNYEADDCIGSLATLYSDNNDSVMVLTGDHDILQLVSTNIDVIIMKKGQGNYDVFTDDNFYEKKGIYPQQVIDLKGLMGDSADNYPGVKGIGEKTGIKLLTKYNTIDNIIDNLTDLSSGIQTKILNNRKMLDLSRELAEIKCDVQVSCELETALWSYDYEAFEREFYNLKLPHLVKLLKVVGN